MKIVQLYEMAAKKICPQCGKSMTGNHYWYKGGWKCKGGAGATPQATPAAAAPAATPAPTASPSSPTAKTQHPKYTTPAQPVNVATTPPPAPAPVAASANLRKKLVEWLGKWMNAPESTIDVFPDNTVTVTGDIRSVGGMNWEKLPIVFKEVTGDVDIIAGRLVTLMNFPETVGGDVNVSANALVSLNYFPKTVGGDVSVNHNPVSSLEGLPEIIPGNLDISNTHIKSLRGIHKIVKEIDGELVATGIKIGEGGLGLLAIKKLRRVALSDTQLQEIINKYLAGDRDVLACQEELIDAGLTHYARM